MGQDVRRPARVAPPRARFRVQRFCNGEIRRGRDTVEHVGHVGERIRVLLLEFEAARHVQELGERDRAAARVALRFPFRNRRRRFDREPSILHQCADECIHHALGHRPADQSCVLVKPFGIAFRNDLPVVHDQHGSGALRQRRVWLRERPVHGAAELRSVDVRGRVACGAQIVGHDRWFRAFGVASSRPPQHVEHRHSRRRPHSLVPRGRPPYARQGRRGSPSRRVLPRRCSRRSHEG